MNAYRVGYGSDTYYDPRLNERFKVTAETTTTKSAAKVDLMARVPEFMDRARRVVTGPIWDKLNANQQAALCSLAYNTGSVRIRVYPDDPQKTAAALRALPPPSKLSAKVQDVLRRRRAKEAAVYLKPVSTLPHQPPIAVGTSAAAGAAILQYIHANPTLIIGAIAIAICFWGIALWLGRKKPAPVQTSSERLQSLVEEWNAIGELIVETRLDVQKERDNLTKLLDAAMKVGEQKP